MMDKVRSMVMLLICSCLLNYGGVYQPMGQGFYVWQGKCFLVFYCHPLSLGTAFYDGCGKVQIFYAIVNSRKV